MICVHITGIWRFLRVGVGADDVKAIFCTICRPCIARISSLKAGDEADLVSRKYQDSISTIKQVEKGNHLVVVDTFDQVEYFLKEGRPLVRIGKTKTTVIFP